MSNTIIVTTDMLLGVLRRMFDRGEITLSQYAESLRRSKVTPIEKIN